MRNNTFHPNITSIVINSTTNAVFTGENPRANTTVSTSVAGGKSVSIGTAIAIGLGGLVLGGYEGVKIARLYYGHRADIHANKYNELANRLKNLENDMANE